MEITYRIDKDILYIGVEGRIDASNSAVAEEKISYKARRNGKRGGMVGYQFEPRLYQFS